MASSYDNRARSGQYRGRERHYSVTRREDRYSSQSYASRAYPMPEEARRPEPRVYRRPQPGRQPGQGRTEPGRTGQGRTGSPTTARRPIRRPAGRAGQAGRARTYRAARPLRRRSRFLYKNPGGVQAPFLANLLILLVFGLIMLFSASYATGYYYGGDSYEYIRPQFLYALLGLGVMWMVSYLDYHWLRQWAYPFYTLALVLLVLVLIPGLGKTVNGCTRWIKIEGVPMPSIQPSEVAKFAIILLTAHLLTSHSKRLKNFFYVIVLPIALLLPIELLLHMEPHNSAIILMAGILFIMLWAGGVAKRWFFMGAGAGAMAMTIFILTRQGYVQERLAGWLDPFSDVKDSTLQIAQSLYTIGNGGLFGVGIGNSNQKQLWLPEATNDFIFSVLCEELGFVGALVCIGLFAALIVQGIQISLRAPDRFGALLGIDIMAQITLQVLMNIAVVTNTMPNTGISLPFFSSGGTSLVMLLGEIGVLLSVNRAGSAMARDERAEEARRAQQEAQEQTPFEGA